MLVTVDVVRLRVARRDAREAAVGQVARDVHVVELDRARERLREFHPGDRVEPVNDDRPLTGCRVDAIQVGREAEVRYRERCVRREIRRVANRLSVWVDQFGDKEVTGVVGQRNAHVEVVKTTGYVELVRIRRGRCAGATVASGQDSVEGATVSAEWTVVRTVTGTVVVPYGLVTTTD